MKRTNNTVRAYVAGFIDGEGSVRIQKQTHHHRFQYYPVVAIYNTHKPVLLWIKSYYGGTLEEEFGRKSKVMKKRIYRLRFNKEEIKFILNDILEYFIIKQEQAKICLLMFKKLILQKKRNNKGQIQKISEEELSARESLFQQYLLAQQKGKELYPNKTVTKW